MLIHFVPNFPPNCVGRVRLSRHQSEKIKYSISSSEDRTHNPSRLQPHFVPLVDWPPLHSFTKLLNVEMKIVKELDIFMIEYSFGVCERCEVTAAAIRVIALQHILFVIYTRVCGRAPNEQRPV